MGQGVSSRSRSTSVVARIAVVLSVLVASCSSSADDAERFDAAMVDRVEVIFDELDARFGPDRSGDIALGGDCPLGPVTGDLLVEAGLVGCVERAEQVVHFVSNQPMHELFEVDASNELPGHPGMRWVEVDESGGRLIAIGERVDDRLTVGLGAFRVPIDKSGVDYATSVAPKLEGRAALMVAALADYDSMLALLASADEVF